MRRKRHEEHVNHEAWAIPYADLMTLLLAFFVVMYAVSVVNEGKYRVASEALAEAFNGSNRVAVPQASSKDAPRSSDPSISLPTGASTVAPKARAATPKTDLQQIENQVRKSLQPLIDRNMVVVRGGPDRLEIEIRTDVLFPSGVASLAPSAGGVLSSMAGILAPFGNSLRVEGFTDNVPIATSMYPSNWELSAARAASVARLFADHGVSPDRLGIVGWGEVRPIADNATVEGRNRNRRVLVVVMGGHEPTDRPRQDVGQLGMGPSSPPAVGSATSDLARGASSALADQAQLPEQVPAAQAAAFVADRERTQPSAVTSPSQVSPAPLPQDGKQAVVRVRADAQPPSGLR
ncbi:MAG: flagellar motor protein MotD [Rhodanobacter sp.]